MKHVREDRAFIYYYVTFRETGESCGLRFSPGTVTSFRGKNEDPELIHVGEIVNLPVGPDDPTGDLYDAIASVVDQHPEVTDILAGRIGFEQALKPV